MVPASSKHPETKQRAAAILVVEDEPLIRLDVSHYLQESGFRVYEAGSAFEAIRIMGVTLPPIDLVFTDIQMPGEIDGIGLLQWIKRNRPGLSVILTSGRAKREDVAQALSKNDAFLEKPYVLSQVLAQVRGLIDMEHFEAGKRPAVSDDPMHKLLAALTAASPEAQEWMIEGFNQACQEWYDRLSESEKKLVNDTLKAWRNGGREKAIELAAALPPAPRL
jgi:CheY-like chemotaxis protein